MSGSTHRDTSQATDPSAEALPGRLLGDLTRPVPGGEDELIRNRFLCRGGSSLLVAGTGLGKSVLVLQLAIAWAVGKGFAGLLPARPLRTWLIQGENSEGDIAEQRDGIVWGLVQSGVLNEAEWGVARSHVRIVTQTQYGGYSFGDWLDAKLRNARDVGQLPDVIIIDPAFAYLGADASSQADVSVFLRNILNPILQEFRLGLLLVHHANKPLSASGRRETGPADHIYAGAGSAEWSNWARGTIVLERTDRNGLFALHAGKNGHKLGWRDPATNEPVYQHYIAHATDGRIYWWEPDAAAIAAEQACGTRADSAARRQVTVEDVVLLADVPRTKADLEERVRSELKAGRDSARSLLKAAVARGLLEEADVKIFPRQTLIGLPGATAAEAARRSNLKTTCEAAAETIIPTSPPSVPSEAAGSHTPPVTSGKKPFRITI